MFIKIQCLNTFSDLQRHICSGAAIMQVLAKRGEEISLYCDKISFRTGAYDKIKIPEDTSSLVPLQLNILLLSIEMWLLTFLTRCTAHP